MFVIHDVEACEPSELPVDPEVHLVFEGLSGTSANCARLGLYCLSRERLESYLRTHWHGAGEWLDERVAEMEETADDALRGRYEIQTSLPGAKAESFVVADSPIHALDVFAVECGFVPYSELIVAPELSEEERSGYLYWYENPDTGEVLLSGIMTNYEVSPVWAEEVV